MAKKSRSPKRRAKKAAPAKAARSRKTKSAPLRYAQPFFTTTPPEQRCQQGERRAVVGDAVHQDHGSAATADAIGNLNVADANPRRGYGRQCNCSTTCAYARMAERRPAAGVDK